MEQQCVTIAKAGMHVSLNARCTVLAAANPIYGTFDPTLDLAKNIGMPDSLLSRFDLVYVIRDLTTEEIDRSIATQVLRQAQMRCTGSQRRGVEQVHSSILERRQEPETKAQEATEVFEKTIPGTDGEAAREVVTVDFLRKYLRYCRRLKPVLSQQAQAMVANKYVELRMKYQSGFAELQESDNKKPRLAVTTRTLEALIRLATAHAKLKLRKDEVLEEDVEQAHRLMLMARDEEDPSMRDAASSASGAPPAGGGSEGSRKRPRAEMEGVDAEGDGGAPFGTISAARLAALTTLVARTFARQGGQEVSQGSLLESVNAGLAEGEPEFVEDEFAAGLAGLEAQNKVMLLDTGDVV
eukprot:CAMPEP_0179374600 /NCGR_PEP_ID=MMETSP0797-20121207/87382_1 /TAXON_ID=47934 /ORGANISM="Dinophysis acuminata, Strain DAEP01" /LENGTH=353 /DNA_ID=CAMNT_0021090603 /DNA_START=1 /DNA_END=1058 /DNA_ORIENTATION=-